MKFTDGQAISIILALSFFIGLAISYYIADRFEKWHKRQIINSRIRIEARRAKRGTGNLRGACNG